MLSSTVTMTEFLAKISTYEFEEIISLANQEATAAERRFYQCLKREPEPNGQLLIYATALKDFIVFMRYGIQTYSLRGLDLTHLPCARKKNMTRILI